MPGMVKQAQKGQPIPASGWNRMADFLKRNIVGGKGITIRRAGQQLVISSTATGGARGGAGLGVDIVETLPTIPATGIRWVYWTSAGVGTGDNQVWRATEHDTTWWPTQKATILLGTAL